MKQFKIKPNEFFELMIESNEKQLLYKGIVVVGVIEMDKNFKKTILLEEQFPVECFIKKSTML